ncbi:exonuclease V, chloroplastic-like [Vigna unguiculata]|uniref:Exonuclease V n=1 Tax=Vigna unguiculata TaxID=3917 RepID=A0A4D6L7P6_VIGUN|nr:exonuclease V, chloroplastic-like [Vigna unguiculata]QCD84425.1 Exonuclease V [Vigna unguiculata]
MVRTSSKKIPIVIPSDDENFYTEVSTPSKRTPPSTSKLHRNDKSIDSVSGKAKRRLCMCSEPDIEDYGDFLKKKEKKIKADNNTLLHRFRSKKGLFVTDVTKTEWCERQMEFSLFSEEWKNNEGRPMDSGGGRRNSEAMKAGRNRHVQLELEVHSWVELKVKSREDDMAMKLVNFINGVNQLAYDGLTRELPILSFAFAEGIWMVGKIDEVQMPKAKKDRNPILIETKTRFQDTVPSEAQKRNGRIQLMCYKYLWDNLVAHAHHDFPRKQLYDYFELNPRRTLSKDLQAACEESGFTALTLGDVVRCYQNTCKMLPPSNKKLVLRYESQRDHSVLDEEKIAYDEGWVKSEIGNCLELWLGQREASYVAEDEQWKCGYCDFVSECQGYTDTDSESTQFVSDYSSE